MGDFFVGLFWFALYALPVVVLVGIPVLIWQARRRRKAAD
jgi:uncharacterized Tic20 family protein